MWVVFLPPQHPRRNWIYLLQEGHETMRERGKNVKEKEKRFETMKTEDMEIMGVES